MVNQYARSAGHMSLVQGLAKKYSAPIGRQIDPINEVVVTDGACQYEGGTGDQKRSRTSSRRIVL